MLQALFATLVTAAGLAGAVPEPSPASATMPAGPRLGVIQCTPETVNVNGRIEQVKNPIAAALTRARPGDVVELMAGRYPQFSIGFDKNAAWNARTSGGLPGQPITVRGNGKVTIVGQGSGDTIAFSQKVKNGHITFENLTIVPAGRAGLMFYKGGASTVYEGFRFYDVDILGSWNHALDRGQNSKWAVWGHSLKDFEFVGKRRPAVVRDIRHEHAFYLQNPRGDITIQNVQATGLGRTFAQFTARPGDGPPGIGTITIKDCVIEEVGIAKGDNYKGGSAITIAGRLSGTTILENNVYRQGFRPELRRLTRNGAPYGTGAVMVWDGGGVPNGTVILRNNRFELAPGCGDRPVVSLGGCRVVRLEGSNKLVGGAHDVVLEIDPVQKGKPRNTKIESIWLDPRTQLEGGTIERLGRRIRLEDLSAR